MRDELTTVPADLAEVVHRAIGAVPGYVPDVAMVHRRRTRRRRQYVAGLAAGLAVLATPPAVLQATASRPDPVPVQRTFLTPVLGWPDNIFSTCGVLEVSAAGQLVTHPVPTPPGRSPCVAGRLGIKSEWWQNATALPGGRTLVFWPDGTVVDALVLSADGTVESRRPLPAGVGGVFGVDGWTGYYSQVQLRPGNYSAGDLFTYDVRTGNTRPLFRLSDAWGESTLIGQLTVAGGRLAGIPGLSKTVHCAALVTDLRRGRDVAQLPLGGTSCTPSAIRLSADGRRLAVLYTAQRVTRVAAYDVATGRILADQALPTPPNVLGALGLPALGWIGDTQIRAAWFQSPDSAKGHFYTAAQALRTYTMRVPG